MRQLLAGMSPHSGVSQVPRALPVGLHKIHRLAIPSNTEYSVPQLRMMIREIEEILGREVTFDEWNRL